MLIALLISLAMATGSGPMHAALEATEAPETFRAAFTVELVSNSAQQTYSFDPRLPAGARWVTVARLGQDAELDQVAASWAAEVAPDGRLFPDDLRASLGPSVDVNTDGDAWRVSFRHHPNYNDSEFDVWAAERLKATAWLDPVGERFQRIEYTLPKPVRGPSGGKLTRYEQSYLLKTEPRWGFSYVSGFTIDLEAKAAFKRINRRFEARVTDIQFFFASPAAEAEYDSRRAAAVQMASGFSSPGR
ncbi:MAG: hypothetical protein FP825_04070 [Hyphomonas sp.]|uniref:hypothetical protein n=1 Tax=Hyphomonas sp. TaxID=87 RepID=UPI0017E93E15|nr:hypothetical protein [Hyphomonas sp.]MBA3067644.1 hypothetical protein [Hyphomonas sp.]MBU4062270.1 hypothetical protein [Alphaproteobacteria bacterium]MBU4165705.1 hypothetical protein [Alphaproteobacteria bacterium]MBU4568859.1 hypothetical protein [Alphaproteobacteria bacterium]